jgi:hypothetical protein
LDQFSGLLSLGHQDLHTTQTYARIHDETLYGQFKQAMSTLEGIAVDDWPGREIVQYQLAAQNSSLSQ